MSSIVQLQVQRRDLKQARVVTAPLTPPAPGEVVVAIDRFALTANNVSYALTGESIGYWGYFPIDADWGLVPVWGFATVTASACPDIAVGERLYGFFPMASHAQLAPGKVSASGFTDMAAHRRDLPALYNRYSRLAGEPPALADAGDVRALLFPLFATSWVLADYLDDNAAFGASQVLIASASSKTAFGLAWMLTREPAVRRRVVGLTSARNLDFTRSLGLYDEVVAYEDIASLPAEAPAVLVDMSGSAAVLQAVDDRLGERVKANVLVGATHWDAGRRPGALKGAAPAFFFAPGQFAKREADWGPGVALRRAMEASARIAADAGARLEVRHLQGADAAREAWLDMLAGRTPPRAGLMLSLG